MFNLAQEMYVKYVWVTFYCTTLC